MRAIIRGGAERAQEVRQTGRAIRGMVQTARVVVGDTAYAIVTPVEQVFPDSAPTEAAPQVVASPAIPAGAVGDTVTLAANQASAAAQAQPATQTAAKPEPKPVPKPEVVAKKPVEQPKPKPVPPKPVEVKKPVESKPQAGQIKSMDDLIASKMTTQAATPAPVAAAPAQGSWILQLGAFKNADSVNALVGKLRAAGYSAQTSPRTPVQGQINRVFIGPDVSKAKLQGMQSRISQMTGLSGSVVAYNP